MYVSVRNGHATPPSRHVPQPPYPHPRQRGSPLAVWQDATGDTRVMNPRRRQFSPRSTCHTRDRDIPFVRTRVLLGRSTRPNAFDDSQSVVTWPHDDDRIGTAREHVWNENERERPHWGQDRVAHGRERRRPRTETRSLAEGYLSSHVRGSIPLSPLSPPWSSPAPVNDGRVLAPPSPQDPDWRSSTWSFSQLRRRTRYSRPFDVIS